MQFSILHFLALLSIVIVEAQEPEGCPSGWVSFENFCYKFVANSPKKWINARADCLSYGGDLVSIHNASENAFIIYQANLQYSQFVRFWIGLNDRANENVFEWSDGSNYTFKNWEPNEPNNLGGAENCVQLELHASSRGHPWNDASCEIKYNYVCKQQKDVDECLTDNGGCSHSCTNTPGAYRCTCADPELSLGADNHTCEADGVTVNCGKDDMSITLPKSLLLGLDCDHLRLLNTSCQATETASHCTLKTPLTGCGTTSRHTDAAVVYSNKVSEMQEKEAIVRRAQIEIPFRCYYDNDGVVSTVGLKPSSKKLVFSENGQGNFSLSLDMFPDQQYTASFSDDDFPVEVALRKRLYFQVSVMSADKRLSIVADRCFATPTQDRNGPTKYEFISGGCSKDDTIQFHSSASTHEQRFSLEAFEFIAENAFVFIHCDVKICNATDPNSKCIRGCLSRARRAVEHVPSDGNPLYSLAQGPLVMSKNTENDEPAINIASNGVAANLLLVLLTVLSAWR